MRGFIISMLLIVCGADLFSQAAIPASRRQEKTPLQFTFGSFSSIAPYNEASGYTVVPDAQIQPSALISDNNTFASTGDFTVIQKDDASSTFTVASNIGTVTTGSAATANFILGSTASSFLGPNIFAQVQITQNGTTSGTDVLGFGIMTSTLQINAEFNQSGTTNMYIHVFTGGTHTTLSPVAFTVPTAPWTLGFSLVNGQASAWSNSGSGWQLITTASVTSLYDPTTVGNLTGAETAIKTFTSQVTTWKFANMKTGTFGGVGMRDQTIICYPDGRPYMNGSVVYFLATIGGVSNGTQDSGNGVFSLDLNGNTLTQVSLIMDTVSGHIYNNSAGQIIYDPAAGTQKYLISTWGFNTTFGTITTLYASTSTGTLNLMTSGTKIIPSLAQITFASAAGSHGYDPFMVCSQWNYSAGTCGKWLLAYAAVNSGSPNPAVQSTTSDPSVNSWTSVGVDSGTTTYEGSRILRTATGSGGVAYYPAWGGAIGSSTRGTRVYSSPLTFAGSLNATLPAGSLNPPHPMIFEYGNNEYFLTFNDNVFGSITSSTMGNLILATAPKY